MKAYNETWIRNKYIIEQAGRWNRQGLLSADQLQAVRQAFPVNFQDSNGFVEIGLFIFTLIAAGGSYFLLTTFLPPLSTAETIFHGFNIGFGVVTFLITGQLIRSRSFYRSGVDNALIVASVTALSAGVVGLLPDGAPLWIYCLAVLVVLLPAVWYYGDLLLTLAVFVAFVTAVFDVVLDLPGGKQLLPFILMGLSVAGYLTSRPLSNRETLLYWEDGLTLVMWLSLGLLLVSVNYLAVREVNHFLSPDGRSGAPEIALPWLFWILTVGVPVGLLALGIRQKNRPLLLMGAIGWLVFLATWRYYHPLFSVETYLLINGVVLILAAIALIRHLRVPRNGFTDIPDEESPKEFLLSAETLLAIQAASAQTPPKGMQFGGGDFSGGGAGDRYSQ